VSVLRIVPRVGTGDAGWVYVGEVTIAIFYFCEEARGTAWGFRSERLGSSRRLVPACTADIWHTGVWAICGVSCAAEYTVDLSEIKVPRGRLQVYFASLAEIIVLGIKRDGRNSIKPSAAGF
jgi:hypothetical protein